VKVSELMKQLGELKPDDDIIALWWEKPSFDYDPEDEVQLTDSAWQEICREFNEWEDAGNDISEWIADAVIEKSEENL